MVMTVSCWMLPNVSWGSSLYSKSPSTGRIWGRGGRGEEGGGERRGGGGGRGREEGRRGKELLINLK